MQVTAINHQVYSVNGEVAFQITYSDGTNVRAVQSSNAWVRIESLTGNEWKQVGKPYVVKVDRKRQAERIIQAVKTALQ